MSSAALTWEEACERARAKINALCHGERWTMRVPPAPGVDPDLVLSDALDAADAEIARLRAELAGAREDKERMDYLEGELEREGSRHWCDEIGALGGSIFRRNVPVTRAAIDACRSLLSEGGA